MNRREPHHPRRPAPVSGYPYGPGFSESGGSYVDVDAGRTLPNETGAYQRFRPWGPQDGVEDEADYAQRDARDGRDDRGYGPDIEPPRDFRGRGPRGYVRSDERLKEIICDRLADDPRIDASEVTVDVTGGQVTLSGEVDSRRTKHLLEDLVDDCRGVTGVDNRLRIAGKSS